MEANVIPGQHVQTLDESAPPGFEWEVWPRVQGQRLCISLTGAGGSERVGGNSVGMGFTAELWGTLIARIISALQEGK